MMYKQRYNFKVTYISDSFLDTISYANDCVEDLIINKIKNTPMENRRDLLIYLTKTTHGKEIFNFTDDLLTFYNKHKLYITTLINIERISYNPLLYKTNLIWHNFIRTTFINKLQNPLPDEIIFTSFAIEIKARYIAKVTGLMY